LPPFALFEAYRQSAAPERGFLIVRRRDKQHPVWTDLSVDTVIADDNETFGVEMDSR
jgi:hypothetical protein